MYKKIIMIATSATNDQYGTQINFLNDHNKVLVTQCYKFTVLARCLTHNDKITQ